MRRVFLAAALIIGALGAVPPANAQAPPTLTGEFLGSVTAAQITGNDPVGCGSRERSTNFTYEVSGIATGPYPGTFTETGRVTIGPETEEFLPGQFRGTILFFEADFTITSPVGTVEGTKRLSTTVRSVGGCIGDPTRLAGAQILTRVTYEATITTATGTYEDEGTGFVNFNAYTVVPPAGSTNTQYEFREGFTSSQLTPTPVDEDEPAVAVVVTPPTAINEVGTDHTVTATATTAAGVPDEGVIVRFTVEGSVETTGQCTTNAQGQCTFTYTGPPLPGADLITACADNNSSGTIDPGEPCGAATKIWILPVLVTTPGQVTGGGWITSTGGRVSFGFNAKSDGDKTGGNCNVIDHATKTQIKCLTVDALAVAGTHATFTGQARVDGAVTDYRIDVDDLGEPGVLDTFKIQTDSGYTAAGRLDGGNIQIHR